MSATPGSRAKELYEFGPFRVDPEKQTLLRNGKSVPLTPKSYSYSFWFDAAMRSLPKRS